RCAVDGKLHAAGGRRAGGAHGGGEGQGLTVDRRRERRSHGRGRRGSALGDRELPDLVGVSLGEPELAIWACDETLRGTVGGGNRVARDGPGGCDLSDLIRVVLGEPDIAVGPRREPARATVGRGHRELGENACGGDTTDLVRVELVEPEVTV